MDNETLSFAANSRIDALMEKLDRNREDTELIQSVDDILRLLSSTSIDPDLWKAQNIYFSIGKNLYGAM